MRTLVDPERSVPPNERSDPAANWLKTHITDGDNNSTKGDKQETEARVPNVANEI